MNIKLDENLPERLVVELQLLGHNVDTVRTEHLTGRDDNEVWQAAQSGRRFLITQDLDFSDVHLPANHDAPVRIQSRLLILNGGQGRNRTADASLFRAALYRLSYLAAGWNSQLTK